jgi:hypothetical protein
VLHVNLGAPWSEEVIQQRNHRDWETVRKKILIDIDDRYRALSTFGKLLCSGSSFPLNVGPYQWPVPHQISPHAPMLMKAHLDAQLDSPAYSLGSPAIQPLASIRGLVMLF